MSALAPFRNRLQMPPAQKAGDRLCEEKHDTRSPTHSLFFFSRWERDNEVGRRLVCATFFLPKLPSEMDGRNTRRAQTHTKHARGALRVCARGVHLPIVFWFWFVALRRAQFVRCPPLACRSLPHTINRGWRPQRTHAHKIGTWARAHAPFEGGQLRTGSLSVGGGFSFNARELFFFFVLRIALYLDL